jgi:4'-phosphopantetheinyl transferase EntD
MSAAPRLYAPPLQALYPAGAVVAVLHEPGDPRLLLPEEARSVEGAVPARVQEFAAGRQCARIALAELGITGAPLRAAPDRSPVWPRGIVGSISHTRGHCAAVVGRSDTFLGLGLDTERLEAVRSALWPRLFVPSELERLEALPAARRALAAALGFAAKEAFYKLQYPLVRERLGFDAIAIVCDARAVMVDGEVGAFTVVPERPLALQERYAGALTGRCVRHDGFVSAAIALAAEAPPAAG